MYGSLFARDMFAELDRLQRSVQQAFDGSPSIRGHARHGFPALNVGGTPTTLEIYAFAPGVDPASLEVDLERGVLTVSGERRSSLPPSGSGQDSRSAVHINERFAGRFRRVMTLPDDIDPEKVEAQLRDGVLHITIQRRAAAQPRRITVQ